MVTRVVNLNDLSPSVEHELNVLRIGAGTSWANPYAATGTNGHATTIPESSVSLAKYVLYLSECPNLQRAIPSLAGRVLGCVHPPGRCHGEILAALADGREALPALAQRAGAHLWRPPRGLSLLLGDSRTSTASAVTGAAGAAWRHAAVDAALGGRGGGEGEADRAYAVLARARR